ncbi:DUF1735 domain-containing protein [Mucilaginibacter psychrotolerans]|uniref:DUF1735 domain-containing protein n=1 Tax=Mucilaginibacter psychrotolerans TaxID=1524096 RepID=A0A4Y8SP35_9SPHI|nr:DUF1735 domain-containing protein [Mucilaginibacter psychrotolerans]TFF40156.1 DUF1735 domain-containing protein [Mucilaginibacter psychrotolerans]
MKKFICLTLLSVSLAGLTSCLKDKTSNIDPDGSPSTVSFSTSGSDGTVGEVWSSPAGAPFYVFNRSFDAVASAQMPITVQYGGSTAAPTDVTVNLGINTAAIATYNAAVKTSYVQIPTSLVTFPASVVIPKGQRKAVVMITLKLNTADYDFNAAYVLPISITSASSGSVSGNFGTLLYRIIAKNIYEASYTTTGYFFHPSAGRALNSTKKMSTVSAVRVEIPLGDLGGSNYYVDFDVNGSALSNYAPAGATPTGAQSGFFTSDQPGATGSWSPSTPGTNGFVHSTYNNTYDAASKTFFLHYGYGVGSAGQTGWTRQIYEKWVRQ